MRQLPRQRQFVACVQSPLPDPRSGRLNWQINRRDSVSCFVKGRPKLSIVSRLESARRKSKSSPLLRQCRYRGKCWIAQSIVSIRMVRCFQWFSCLRMWPLTCVMTFVAGFNFAPRIRKRMRRAIDALLLGSRCKRRAVSGRIDDSVSAVASRGLLLLRDRLRSDCCVRTHQSATWKLNHNPIFALQLGIKPRCLVSFYSCSYSCPTGGDGRCLYCRTGRYGLARISSRRLLAKGICICPDHGLLSGYPGTLGSGPGLCNTYVVACPDSPAARGRRTGNLRRREIFQSGCECRFQLRALPCERYSSRVARAPLRPGRRANGIPAARQGDGKDSGYFSGRAAAKR